MEEKYVALKDTIHGTVLLPTEEGDDAAAFEKARTAVWNFDACGVPKLIVLVESAQDVSECILFAKEHRIPLCVHTAGAHSSHAVVDGCLVVDLSRLRTVAVDAENCTITVAGGAMIGDVDDACQQHGLALPMGHVYHTGVAGMALNATSGVGYLCRTRGLTASYLQQATMVLHDGTVETVTPSHDLFWALQGAGANFGIAVEMVFRLTRVAPTAFAGDLVQFPKGTGPGKYLWCIDSTVTREELVTNWIEFFQKDTTPDECASLLVLTPQGGPIVSRLTYNPKEQDADLPVVDIVAKAREAFQPLTSFGYTLLNNCKAMSYHAGTQKLGKFMPSYYYQKAANLASIPPGELDKLVSELCEMSDQCPINNMGTAIILMPLGGELAKMSPDQCPTADVFSTMKWWFVVIAEFPKGPKDKALRDKCVEWVREVHALVEPYGSKDEGRESDYWYDVLGDIYGSNVTRLMELKQKYDPENTFRWNRNIKPQAK